VNQTRAASFLQISRNVLIYRMQRYRLGQYKDLPADTADIPEDKDDPNFPATRNFLQQAAIDRYFDFLNENEQDLKSQSGTLEGHPDHSAGFHHHGASFS